MKSLNGLQNKIYKGVYIKRSYARLFMIVGILALLGSILIAFVLAMVTISMTSIAGADVTEIPNYGGDVAALQETVQVVLYVLFIAWIFVAFIIISSVFTIFYSYRNYRETSRPKTKKR